MMIGWSDFSISDGPIPVRMFCFRDHHASAAETKKQVNGSFVPLNARARVCVYVCVRLFVCCSRLTVDVGEGSGCAPCNYLKVLEAGEGHTHTQVELPVHRHLPSHDFLCVWGGGGGEAN